MVRGGNSEDPLDKPSMFGDFARGCAIGLFAGSQVWGSSWAQSLSPELRGFLAFLVVPVGGGLALSGVRSLFERRRAAAKEIK